MFAPFPVCPREESIYKVKQKLDYARKNWPENLKKYEQQENTLGRRNSYSKTDTDATFMRMKTFGRMPEVLVADAGFGFTRHKTVRVAH